MLSFTSTLTDSPSQSRYKTLPMPPQPPHLRLGSDRPRPHLQTSPPPAASRTTTLSPSPHALSACVPGAAPGVDDAGQGQGHDEDGGAGLFIEAPLTTQTPGTPRPCDGAGAGPGPPEPGADAADDQWYTEGSDLSTDIFALALASPDPPGATDGPSGGETARRRDAGEGRGTGPDPSGPECEVLPGLGPGQGCGAVPAPRPGPGPVTGCEAVPAPRPVSQCEAVPVPDTGTRAEAWCPRDMGRGALTRWGTGPGVEGTAPGACGGRAGAAASPQSDGHGRTGAQAPDATPGPSPARARQGAAQEHGLALAEARPPSAGPPQVAPLTHRPEPHCAPSHGHTQSQAPRGHTQSLAPPQGPAPLQSQAPLQSPARTQDPPTQGGSQARAAPHDMPAAAARGCPGDLPPRANPFGHVSGLKGSSCWKQQFEELGRQFRQSEEHCMTPQTPGETADDGVTDGLSTPPEAWQPSHLSGGMGTSSQAPAVCVPDAVFQPPPLDVPSSPPTQWPDNQPTYP